MWSKGQKRMSPKCFWLASLHLCNGFYVSKPARSKEWELTLIALECHCYIRFSWIQMFCTTSWAVGAPRRSVGAVTITLLGLWKLTQSPCASSLTVSTQEGREKELTPGLQNPHSQSDIWLKAAQTFCLMKEPHIFWRVIKSDKYQYFCH